MRTLTQRPDDDRPEPVDGFPQEAGDDEPRGAALIGYNPTTSACQSFSRLKEQIATAKCLLGNPKLAMRIFQQAASRFVRSRRCGF
jgi:hypothetical protein